MSDHKVDAATQAAMNAGAKFGMDMLGQIPKGDALALEAHLTGVLTVFWAALWGSLGSEYARGFIEAQLSSMEPHVPNETWVAPPVQ